MYIFSYCCINKSFYFRTASVPNANSWKDWEQQPESKNNDQDERTKFKNHSASTRQKVDQASDVKLVNLDELDVRSIKPKTYQNVTKREDDEAWELLNS